MIDGLFTRKDLLIHLITGNLAGFHTRGAASNLASDEYWNKSCVFHPRMEGVPPERDWHVIYDPEEREAAEKQLGVPNPIESLLHHEIFGHILPILRDPTLLDRIRSNSKLKDENERNAVQEENRYRRYLGLPDVSPGQSPSSKP